MWYLIFDDIWYTNYKRVHVIEKNYRLFNPEYNSFLGFHLMDRDSLYYVLEEYSLLDLFPDQLIS